MIMSLRRSMNNINNEKKDVDNILSYTDMYFVIYSMLLCSNIKLIFIYIESTVLKYTYVLNKLSILLIKNKRV